MINRRTGIDDDNFSPATRDDPLKHIVWSEMGSGKTGRTHMEIGSVTHDHSPCPRSGEYLVYCAAYRFIILSGPPSVPQRAIRLVQLFFLPRRIYMTTIKGLSDGTTDKNGYREVNRDNDEVGGAAVGHGVGAYQVRKRQWY